MGKVFSFSIVFHFFFLTLAAGKNDFKGPTEQARTHYKAIVAIEALFSKLPKKERKSDLKEAICFEDGPNPYWNQTEQGLYYVFVSRDKQPYLLTPWGEIALQCEDFVIKEPVQFRLLSAKRSLDKTEIFGFWGPIYRIYQVGQIMLPEPRLAKKEDSFSFEEAIAAWEETKQSVETDLVK